jgi:hypothetical protein
MASQRGCRLRQLFADFSTALRLILWNNSKQVGQDLNPLKSGRRTTFGLRHMPALRVGILMHSWSSSAALLIKDWFEATPKPRAPNGQSA